MFKIMWLMKRRPGTSMRDLVDYYENHHSRLGTALWTETGVAPARYMRRYLRPLDVPSDDALEPPHDVATEMWFDSQDHFDRFMAAATSAQAIEMFIEDERRFLDRDKTVTFVIEEHETDLTAL